MTGAWLGGVGGSNALYQTDVKMGDVNVQQSVPASLPLQPQVQGNELNVLPEDIIRSFGVTTVETSGAAKAVAPNPAAGTCKPKLPAPPVTERGMKLLTASDVNCILNIAEAVNVPPSEGLLWYGITVPLEKSNNKRLGSSSQQISAFTTVTRTTTTSGAGTLNDRLRSGIASQWRAQKRDTLIF